MEKLNKYYKRTAESDAHIITMGLCSYIHFYITLQEEVKELVKTKVCTGIHID